MIYFTSDLHLGHRGIIEMQNRPFENVEEMNRVLVGNYNEVVHKNDTVYFLGDISHHMPIGRVNELLSMMKGKKILIKGNHDKKYDSKLFEEICDFKTVSLNGQFFALMHILCYHGRRRIVGVFSYMDIFMGMKTIICRIGKIMF